MHIQCWFIALIDPNIKGSYPKTITGSIATFVTDPNIQDPNPQPTLIQYQFLALIPTVYNPDP